MEDPHSSPHFLSRECARPSGDTPLGTGVGYGLKAPTGPQEKSKVVQHRSGSQSLGQCFKLHLDPDSAVYLFCLPLFLLSPPNAQAVTHMPRHENEPSIQKPF